MSGVNHCGLANVFKLTDQQANASINVDANVNVEQYISIRVILKLSTSEKVEGEGVEMAYGDVKTTRKYNYKR